MPKIKTDEETMISIRCSRLVLLGVTILCLFLLYKVPAGFAADPTTNMFAPLYVLENGIEKSRRSYLLVYLPDSNKKRQISVVSECQKPYQEEGVYGKCKHLISILPTGKRFTVESGEDVVMIATAWDTPLVLGTVDYGCCAEPLTITFYNEDGDRLGVLKKPHRSRNSLYGNAITRLWDLGNSTGRRNKVQFFIIQDDRKDELFYALRKKIDGKFLNLPIYYKNPNEEKCDEWFLSEFVKYGDRDDTTLVLEGFYCAKNTKEGHEKKLYSCHEQDKAIECMERR